MTRSLVVAPQWIGDAVMSEPLLARLAARGERLTVAALPWVAPVYRAMPQVGDVIELPFAHGRLDAAARLRVARELRGRFDAAYVLPNSFKAALVPWLARIPLRVGYVGEWRFGLLNRRIANAEGRPPMVAYYSALAGEPAQPGGRPHLHFDAARLATATAQIGVEPGAYWVFAPGAEYGPAKCWPPAHYAALARSLHAESGQQVLLLGSAKEATLCESIARESGDGCKALAGGIALDSAMALIAAARGVVSNDSGLMHVAAAFGVPQAALFGSSSPEHTPPLNPRARVLWLKEELQLDCAPCFDRVCRFGHTRCLTELAPERVQAALASVLAAG
jgi:heptosyltransferase-2